MTSLPRRLLSQPSPLGFLFANRSFAGSDARLVCGDIVSLGPEHRTVFRDLMLGLDATSRFNRFVCQISDDGVLRHTDQAVREAAWIVGLLGRAKTIKAC